MKLLMIATGYHRREFIWDLSSTLFNESTLEEGKIKIDFKEAIINDNRIIMFFEDDQENETLGKTKTIAMVKAILTKYPQAEKIYLATHLHDIKKEEINGNNMTNTARFRHEENSGIDIVFDAILQMVQDPTEDTFKFTTQTIEESGELNLMECLSSIKHNICSLFEPLKTDVQGLLEKNDAERANYVIEMVKDYKKYGKNPLNLRLTQLHCAIAGGIFCDNIDVKIRVRPQKAVYNHYEKEWCIKEIIDELHLSSNEVKKLKEKVGLNENWEIDNNSVFVRFINEVDYALDNSNCYLMMQAIERMPNLGQWLVDLNDVLGNLREEAKKKISDAGAKKCINLVCGCQTK